ncbi:HVA22-like protein a isoform X2 [Typha angustifolia]|uniref:HVA22-like protein a isoform X2 n=1 Tax=Typha angustifolia TaxID=59011 RepID=UPI003C30AE5B
MGSGSFLKVVAKNFDVLAGPLVTLAYPLYASVKAIETKSPVDDQQWLTYWVLYSLITLFELTFAKVIEWLPFWSFTKLIFNCWLVLPYFSGAAYVYQKYVRPLYIKQQAVDLWYVPRKKGIFSKPDDVLLAAEKFIEENGPEAFEKLLNKLCTTWNHRKLTSHHQLQCFLNVGNIFMLCNFYAIYHISMLSIVNLLLMSRSLSLIIFHDASAS